MFQEKRLPPSASEMPASLRNYIFYVRFKARMMRIARVLRGDFGTVCICGTMATPEGKEFTRVDR